MAELVAIGKEPTHRWRRTLAEKIIVRLGRAPRHGWSVPWDLMISREHATLTWNDGRLLVQCLDTARNPVLLRGQPHKEFTVEIGGEFQIGDTVFQLVEAVITESMSVIQEKSWGRDELNRIPFSHAEQRIEILAKLPLILAEARGDEEFAANLVTLLLEAVPRAQAAAVVHYAATARSDPEKPRVMRWDGRGDAIRRFRPSRKLIISALEHGRTVLHFWSEQSEAHGFTGSFSFDWAFCTPVPSPEGGGWFLYVSGKVGGIGPSAVADESDLQGDLRFVELIAQFVAPVRRVHRLEFQHAGLSEFISPALMESITDSQAGTSIMPRECDITVLFCDVRGFSRRAERAQQKLHDLLERVSAALSVMTRGITRYDGVIADFQGDAALGFWGWPLPPADGPLPACRAALAIHAEFRRAVADTLSPLAGFQVGIGVAHGAAIAGKIGTDEQSKIGVFGPVVNLGSRLEGLTKQLGAPIILDERTALEIRPHLSRDEGRLRRLARVRPAGMETPVTVYELMPPAYVEGTLTDVNITDYEAAIEAFVEGRWADAIDLFDHLPARDRAKNFLLIYMAQHHYDPPRDWDGVVMMSNK